MSHPYRSDRPIPSDEWPNLSELGAPARFPDGEPVTPLERPSVLWDLFKRGMLGLAFIAVLVIIKACL